LTLFPIRDRSSNGAKDTTQFGKCGVATLPTNKIKWFVLVNIILAMLVMLRTKLQIIKEIEKIYGLLKGFARERERKVLKRKKSKS
jgi:hypothetical protein